MRQNQIIKQLDHVCFYFVQNGQPIAWKSVVDLYREDVKMGGLYLNKKLSSEHVNLNTYSKMKVSLAVQVKHLTEALVKCITNYLK